MNIFLIRFHLSYGMAINKLEMFQVICDKCGKPGGDDETIAWTDAESARTMALASDWKEVGGSHICPDCQEGEGLDEYLDRLIKLSAPGFQKNEIKEYLSMLRA